MDGVRTQVILAAFFLGSTIWAGGARASDGLAGSWQCRAEFMGMTGEVEEVSFDGQGGIVMVGERARYTLESGRIMRVSGGFDTEEYQYNLTGEQLVLAASDGSLLRCVRQSGRGTGSGAPGEGRTPEGIGSGKEIYPAPPEPGGPPQAHAYPGVEQPATDNGWQLNGTYCSWSGSSSSSSSYSSTRRISFDGQGSWSFGSESSFSSGAGAAYGGGGGDSGTYRVVGDQILYQTGTGEQGAAIIKVRRNDGSASEIEVDGALYAPQLCE